MVGALQVAAVEADLAQHLKDVRKKLGCSSINYVSLNKDSHLLDIPDVRPEFPPVHSLLIKSCVCCKCGRHSPIGMCALNTCLVE